jgi:23S rRNA pseudouridine2605 synthase
MEERINKVLARAGVASRRAVDEMIEAGRISVNGQVVTEMGMKVNPQVDEIRLDGERISGKAQKFRYLALYKPRHVITTAFDPFDRPTVMDFVDPNVRLFPVGRLDGNSEGLLILTNDGELANELTHPRYQHEKEYRVKISGTPTEKALKTWREGVYLDEGRTLPATVTVESTTGPSTWLRFVIREGKNRQIRRMIETLGYTVHVLIRTRMGPITLGNLEPGKWRFLNDQEIAALRAGSDEPIQHPAPEPQGAAAVPKRTPEKPQYKEGWARPKPRTDRRTRKPAPGSPRGSGPSGSPNRGRSEGRSSSNERRRNDNRGPTRGRRSGG